MQEYISLVSLQANNFFKIQEQIEDSLEDFVIGKMYLSMT